jgi:tetratricopeptide (TPR) repeat protein
MALPQPIGIYPFPANYLLLPPSLLDSEEHRQLLAGAMPSSDSFYGLALNGDFDGFFARCADDSPESAFNRFVLQPTPEEFARLRSELTGDFGVLLEVAGFTLNFTDRPDKETASTPEFRALQLSALATQHLEANEIDAALATLSAARDAVAAVSPVFAAQLGGNLAEATHQSKGASAEVVMLYKNALAELQKTALDGTTATLSLNLGICYQEMSQGNRGALLEAVRHYQEALRYFTREDFPEEFAFTQNNLALAYLSIPLTEASDTLRVVIAIQSLREALKVYQQETHPELWASTQLNLANALQYAPSGHIEENLMEAVNLYEEILKLRQPTENPVGYARVLANQGNALAHLGVFDHATTKLNEAHAIFAQLGEADSAASIAEVLEEIKTHAATARTASAAE